MTEKLYAGGRMTESQFRNWIRSGLRKMWMRWPPRGDVIKRGRRLAYNEATKRNKYEHRCESCGKWDWQHNMEVDHIIDCGPTVDLNLLIGRMFCEETALRKVCKECHRTKHGR